ncbi:MAG: HD domain-containing protein [Flavobacteriaceae bacterium]|nr:HD domain-containing protein [Flavobacteriaceae bacterium]
MSVNNTNKLKILNDPIYGFITIPSVLIFDLIEHPYFQRLRRISQMGFSSSVYPGAHHTRFHHALGCLYLMQKAVQILRSKGISISEEEETAVCIAILLHDIGHGPYSHALENSIVTGTHHEFISLKFMEELNHIFNKKLTLAIQIFKGEYHRHFLYQLISSQLDIDRLDYLKRDSFYTGVAEGNINSDRLLAMLNVKNDRLVVEEKGIYSVEKFIIGRRLMYWQVYLHKTGFVAEKLLENILKRAKYVLSKGQKLYGSRTFLYFLSHHIDSQSFDLETLERFSKLDDYDVLSAIKEWVYADDKILKYLCESLINRKLFKNILQKQPFDEEMKNNIKQQIKERFKITDEELQYFVYEGVVKNTAYDKNENPIQIMYKDKSVQDITEASDNFNIQALSETVCKYYFSYPKL